MVFIVMIEFKYGVLDPGYIAESLECRLEGRFRSWTTLKKLWNA